jgi:uncharacterized protein YbaA (DUF1428 family)
VQRRRYGYRRRGAGQDTDDPLVDRQTPHCRECEPPFVLETDDTGGNMTYIDGFVIAVPQANKQKFIEHARTGDSVFVDLGAKRILECWGDDVPDGKLTDFRRAVQAKEDEAVVFSWIEWPDKATRDKAMAKMQDLMQSDPRMNPQTNPMPFDGKRMIYGGFAPVVTLEV